MQISAFIGNTSRGLALLFASISIAACNLSSESEQKTLRIAVTPDQNAEEIRRKYTPLMNYITNQTGLRAQLHIPKDYQQLLQWFIAGEVDIANFGGVGFVKAHQQADAKALVFRDIDAQFRSYLLVATDHKAQTIDDLRGETLAFGSELSTSGHLMPRHFFSEQGIQVEAFFSKIEYSGAHDKTALLVKEKKISAGVLNSTIFHQMMKDGRLSSQHVRVIWKSPPFADYVWAAQADIFDKHGSKIRQSFLQLQTANPTEEKILSNLGARYYTAASVNDFMLLQDIMNKLNI